MLYFLIRLIQQRTNGEAQPQQQVGIYQWLA